CFVTFHMCNLITLLPDGANTTILQIFNFLRQQSDSYVIGVIEDVNVSSLCSEFQWLSRLPVTGELDSATLRQMAEPRCGVSDEGSQQIWAQRVGVIFTGKRHHRKRRSTGQGTAVCTYLRHGVRVHVSENTYVCETDVCVSVTKVVHLSWPCRWRFRVSCCGLKRADS
uniref:Peptidoglycan binding-like domain-containing protein n=1 Tax=Stegastes partitus TaxID=144197 RepID=A0A3B5A015_9TELE